MTENRKIWSTKVSRRAALQGIASAVAATPTFLAKTHSAMAAAKMSKAAAGYRGSPNGSQSCANCKLFIPPSSCRLVEGPISAHGWCRLWVGR
jgi:hypothetical protein